MTVKFKLGGPEHEAAVRRQLFLRIGPGDPISIASQARAGVCPSPTRPADHS